MSAYYNEFKPEAAHMLRQLIRDGLIAPGDVDNRPIQEVRPDDLKGYTQCHFFAGIGGWSVALRLAGWDDARPVWTGSCPCQPFSSAGKQNGKADDRHLWPVWAKLICECRPATVFGEQVASAVAHGWWDDVADDLEAEGYAVGVAVLPACSIGKPHKRDRLWFVANRNGNNARGLPSEAGGAGEEVWLRCGVDSANAGLDVANANQQRSQGRELLSERASERTAGADVLEWLTCPDGKQRPVIRNLRGLVDGLHNGASSFDAISVSQSEKEVRMYAASKKQRPEQVMREVRDYYAQEALWKKPRGFFGISEEEILRPYLCELDRRFDQSGISSAIKEIEGAEMRSVRLHSLPSCSPQGWGLHQQQAREYPNSLHALSRVLAQHARQAFEAMRGDAEAIRLLEHGVQHRASLLHGYGNAIVPQVAAAFIGATL